jgi:hypothetical protein
MEIPTKPIDFIQNKITYDKNMFIEQYMGYTSDFNGDLTRTISASCPNGGPIAMTYDPGIFVLHTPQSDEDYIKKLKNNILIYESLGTMIWSVQRTDGDDIVGLGFLKDESVIAVYKSGNYTRIWPYQRRKEERKLVNVKDEILAAKIYDKGIILVTVKYDFWDIENFLKGPLKERRVFDHNFNDGKYEMDEKCALFAVASSIPDNPKTMIFIPKKDGICCVTLSDTGKVLFKDDYFPRRKEQIKAVCVSTNNRNVAIMTDGTIDSDGTRQPSC